MNILAAHPRHILSIFVLLFLVFSFYFLNVRLVYANTLLHTNVEPATLLAGAVGPVNVTFTTVNSIPANGKIRVKFGSGFDVSGAMAGGASCASMNGGFFVSLLADNFVIIIRDGAGNPTVAGSIESCTINAIKNPGISGQTGNYAIGTTEHSGVVIDIHASVTPDTILANALTGVSVMPASLLVGTTTTVNVSFVTVNTIQPTDMIKVTFPTGFSFGSLTVNCPTMDGTFSFSIDSLMVKILRSSGTAAPPGVHTCSINQMINPTTAMTTGVYQVMITDGTGVLVRDQHLAVAGSTISNNVASTVGGSGDGSTGGASVSSTAVVSGSSTVGSSGNNQSDLQETTTNGITIPANGVVDHSILLQGKTGASLLIRKGTRLTNVAGVVYAGLIVPPTVIASEKFPQPLPATMRYLDANSFVPSQDIFFDHDVVITFPLPASANLSIIDLYFYNVNAGAYQLVWDGGTVASDGKSIAVTVNFLATFVLAETVPATEEVPKRSSGPFPLTTGSSKSSSGKPTSTKVVPAKTNTVKSKSTKLKKSTKSTPAVKSNKNTP